MFTFTNVCYKDILSVPHLIIHEKEITCIVGESGSGKTTLLRLLNHLISPDKGSITFHGENLLFLDPVALRRRVVMLPQTPVIFQGSLQDNLAIGLRFSQQPLPAESVFKEVLQRVKLDKTLGEDAEKLSGGEKQRLALGRILLMEPEVLLLDEPSSALDDATESLIMKIFVDYAKEQNKTLIMITHSKALATDFGDRILEVKGGNVYEWDH